MIVHPTTADPDDITRDDLDEAARALASMISKLEKARTGLAPTAKSQLTLIDRRLKALRIAQSLITREMGVF